MKFLLLIGFVFVVVLAQAEDTDVEQPERRAESCTQSAQLDLQLIVDSSGSVGEQHFHEMMKDIADKVLSSFVIGTKNTRVALFKYSHKMVNEFNLDKFVDMKSLKAATAAVKFDAGGTMTGKAMKEALGHFTKKMRKDAKTAKVCIVFTDGLSRDAHIIPGVTKEWAKAGITVFAVGIGKGISKEGLDAIAGDAKRALQVNDFSKLAKFAKTLLIKVCETIQTPTQKTPTQKNQKGSCFSFSEKQTDAFAKLKPLRSMDLDAFTIDLYVTLASRPKGYNPIFISYATAKHHNEFLLGSSGTMHINQKNIIRGKKTYPAVNRKVRYTVTWDGKSGVAIHYMDGKEDARGNRKGKLTAGGVFIVGQDQDKLGGGFQKKQRLIGDLCKLQMWDRVLSATEMKALFEGKAVKPGNVFDSTSTYSYKSYQQGTCFSFGASQQNAYAQLKPLRPMNLAAFTMDFYVTLAQIPKGSNPHYISYAIAKSTNELLLGSSGSTHINSKLVIRGKTANCPAVNRKVHYTVTWDGKSGTVIHYVDGKEDGRGNRKGTLTAGGMFIVGQDQDKLGGGFDKNQRLIGDLCNLQMWDSVLSAVELKALFNGKAVKSGNIFDFPTTYTYDFVGS